MPYIQISGDEHRISWSIENTDADAEEHESTFQHRWGGHDIQLEISKN